MVGAPPAIRPVARTRRDLAPYTGPDAFSEPLRSVLRHSANEPPTAEIVRLCPQTADYLYTKFTPITVRYRPGSRPVLEGLLDEVILRGGPRPRAPRDLLQRIWDWVWLAGHRRLRRVAEPVHRHDQWMMYLGHPEDTAALQTRHDCFCTSRLACALLQVAGVPARLVYMWAWDDTGRFTTSHTAAEACFDGAWRFFDPLCHDHAVLPSGEMASFWQIITEPYCRAEGLRIDTRQHDTGLGKPQCLATTGVQNYLIETHTAHYRLDHGSVWFAPDSPDSRRAARDGI